MIYPFVHNNSTRLAFKTIVTDEFDDSSLFDHGDIIKGSYPLEASINRIFIASGIEKDDYTDPQNPIYAAANKKYIRALKSIINNSGLTGNSIKYSNLGTQNVNMICIPSIY